MGGAPYKYAKEGWGGGGILQVYLKVSMSVPWRKQLNKHYRTAEPPAFDKVQHQGSNLDMHSAAFLKLHRCALLVTQSSL